MNIVRSIGRMFSITAVSVLAAGGLAIAADAVFATAPSPMTLPAYPAVALYSDGVLAIDVNADTIVVDGVTRPMADLADCLKARGAWSTPGDGGDFLYIDGADYGFCAP